MPEVSPSFSHFILIGFVCVKASFASLINVSILYLALEYLFSVVFCFKMHSLRPCFIDLVLFSLLLPSINAAVHFTNTNWTGIAVNEPFDVTLSFTVHLKQK